MTSNGCLFLDDKAQPTVLATLQRVIRALEIVEKTETDAPARMGVIKAKGVVRLFANIWGAEFEEEGVEGLLARKYDAPEASPMSLARKRSPKNHILLDGLERMNGREFTTKDLRAATGLKTDYITPRCSVLAQIGKLKIVGVRKAGKGPALNVYRVVKGGEKAQRVNAVS